MIASQESNQRLMLWVRRWSSISALALLVVTFRLWFPHSTTEPFPQIPLLEMFCAWPLFVDWIAALGLLFGWLLLGVSNRVAIGSALVLICGGLAVLLNQHRLQPWHYQLLVFAGLFLVHSSTRRRPSELRLTLQVFLISIYLYSACSKFDFEFLHTVGKQLVEQGASLLGQKWNASPYLVAWVPTLELLIGLGLCWRVTRRVAGIGAFVLHMGLVVILGPTALGGLGHSWGVLLWNLHFAGIALLLFVLKPTDKLDSESNTESTVNYLSPIGMGWVLLAPVLMLPILERAGYWDHWPSWALYAPHSSRVQVEVAATMIDRLPSSLQKRLAIDEEQLWVRVPIEAWSLEALQAPIYPQARFQLGVARYIARELESDFGIRTTVLGSAARKTGKREAAECTGSRSLENATSAFTFNTRPRE